MEKAIARLKKVTSEGQCETMIHTLGRNIPLHRKAGAAIHVQPTSLSRRAAQITKGSKRLPSGRPPTGSAPLPKKRKHNLSLNVNMNQPNAKMH
jgi:hypothetical protein